MPSPSSTNKGVSTSLYFPRGRVKTIRFAAASFAYHFPTFLPTGKTLICMRRRKKNEEVLPWATPPRGVNPCTLPLGEQKRISRW